MCLRPVCPALWSRSRALCGVRTDALSTHCSLRRPPQCPAPAASHPRRRPSPSMATVFRFNFPLPHRSSWHTAHHQNLQWHLLPFSPISAPAPHPLDAATRQRSLPVTSGASHFSPPSSRAFISPTTSSAFGAAPYDLQPQ